MNANSAPEETGSPASSEGVGWPVVEIAAFVLGFAAYLYAVGWLTNAARLTAARLPIDVISTFPPGRLLGDGLRSTALTAVILLALCVLAYMTSVRRWEVNGQEWHDLVRAEGVRTAANANERVDKRAARETAAEKRWETRHTFLRGRLTWALKPGRPSDSVKRAPNGDALQSAKAIPQPAKPDPAQIGEAGVRIMAGFNILVLAGVLASAIAVGVDELLVIRAWWAILPIWLLAFLALDDLLTRWGPLQVGASLQGGVWLLIAAVALFASVPLGVLVLAGVMIATLGRKVGRIPRPGSLREWVRSPLPWVLGAILALIGLAYQAIPPVYFSGTRITTTGGVELKGGYITRADGGVYLATCTQRSNATSTDEQIQLIGGNQINTLTLGGPQEVLDTGKRPSLAAVALRAIGLKDSVPTLITADLRPRRAACVGGLSDETNGGILGAGALEGTPPPGGQANDGETPIEHSSPRDIAGLAHRFEPTLVVSAADRFWPVSVGAVLAERGSGDQRTCLIQQRVKHYVCSPTPSDLGGPGSTDSDYLQFPSPLMSNPSPELQLDAFERGQNIEPGPAEGWLSNPRILEPWRTAQIYFYYAGPRESSGWPAGAVDSRLPKVVDTLEYWFYYPYNYFPLVVRSELMAEAPVAADLLNVDFHQGDWEHIDVLLDHETHAPLYLYMARHSGEGIFVPWSNSALIFDHAHPVVQGAYGGHPTYVPGCGPQRRSKTGFALIDWLVCGTRFVFRAKDTPLVDIARTPWACWRGHFGEAIPGVEVTNFGKPESVLDKLKHQVFVAGPQSPLLQAENKGLCNGNPAAPEEAASAELPRAAP
jgi:hypothetical protein